MFLPDRSAMIVAILEWPDEDAMIVRAAVPFGLIGRYAPGSLGTRHG